MTNDIFSDHTAMRAALGESVESIDTLMRQIAQGGDGIGLDADTRDKLLARQGMTTGEMEEAIATALLGRQAVDEFERNDDEAAQSLDSGGQTFSTTSAPGAASGGSGVGAGGLGGGGLSAYGAGDPTGVMTNLSSDGASGGSFAEKQALNAQAQAAQAQQTQQIQQAQQMQQMRESAAWQQAMTEQQNRAMLSQMNIAAQQQAMVQAAEMQERIAEQNAAAQAAIAEGGAAPTSGSDVELTAEDIESIIGDLFEEGENFDEGGSLETGDYGERYEPAGLSGLSPDEVSFEKVADGQMSEAEVDQVIQSALDLNGISEDPEVREKFTNLWRAMSLHESGHNANAANGWDSNAHGATQSDGFPYNSSRGPWQCIPTTFAANHIEGTSTSIYDPLASAAASINYTMGRYGIDENGNGLEEFASVRGIDIYSGESRGGYIGY